MKASKFSDAQKAFILKQGEQVIVHAYFGVNLPIIWETIVRRLPKLKIALQTIAPPSN
jgi:Uncharacterized conserved protein